MDLTFLNQNKCVLQNFLKANFNEIFEHFNADTQIYLLGGAIYDILYGRQPKDLDIVLLSTERTDIDDFIKSYGLSYTLNSFGYPKIEHNGLHIDFWNTDDLYKAIQYNVDGLFYDIMNNSIIPFGFIDGTQQRKLLILNNHNTHPSQHRERERQQKLIDSLDLQARYSHNWATVFEPLIDVVMQNPNTHKIVIYQMNNVFKPHKIDFIVFVNECSTVNDYELVEKFNDYLTEYSYPESPYQMNPFESTLLPVEFTIHLKEAEEWMNIPAYAEIVTRDTWS